MNLPSIRTVLVMSLTLMASILIFGLGFHQAFQWEQFTVKTDDVKLDGKLHILYQEVNEILEVRLNALELIAQQISLELETKPFRPQDYYNLIGLNVEKFNMSAAGITNPKGEILESYHVDKSVREKFMKLNLYNNGFIQLIDKLGTSVVLPVRMGKITPKKILILAAPVWDKKQNRIIAYVGASIEPKDLHLLAEKALKGSPELGFMILDENRVLLTSSEQNKHPDPFKPIDSKLYQPTGETLISEGITENGIASRVATRGLEFRNTTFILAVYESVDFLNRQQKVIWKQTALSIGLSVLLSFLISLIISNLITKPISNLVHGMKQIEEGRFHPETDSKKESSLFKETLDAWDALLSMEKKLRENTEILEKEVKERTHQLIETHRDLDEQRGRAMEASRLAALGEMAGGIAHEINNPLGVILASAERQLNKIKRETVDMEQMESSLKLIEGTATRIAKIVQGLRTFSSSGGREPFEKVAVESILNNTLSFCHEKFKHHNIDFRVSEIPQDLMIECSPIQISQVILNLLNNAFDAVQASHQKWIFIDVHDRHEYVEICVSDSGPGIKENLQEKIFQPFFTTKDIGKGTGLGLSITKGIIEKHDGRIFLKKNSQYTTFIIHLPKVHS